MKKRVVFKSATILSMDKGVGDLECGDLLVEDDRIQAIAPVLQVDDAEIVDCTGMILCPGFVDTHRHTWQTPLHGVRTDWNHLDYMTYIRSMYCVCYEPEDAELANWIGAVEALNSGITTLVDHSHLQVSEQHTDGLARGLMKSGIRGIFCYGTYQNPAYRPGDQNIRPEQVAMEVNGPLNDFHRNNARRVREKFFPTNDSRLRFGIAASEFMNFRHAQDMLDEIAWSRSLEPLRISVHVGVTAREPLNIVHELQKADAIASDILFVHGNHNTDEELRWIIDRGATVSSQIEPEMTYGAWPIVNRFTRLGGTSSIGIDVTLDFSGDMFGQMRALLNVWRLELALEDPMKMTRKVHQKRALEVATIKGAEAAGLADVTGSLVPGKQADFFLLRTDKLGIWPMANPYAAVVTYGNQSLVEHVMVAGQFMKRDGAMVDLDWSRVKDQLTRSQRAIRQRFSLLPESTLRKVWADSFGIRIET